MLSFLIKTVFDVVKSFKNPPVTKTISPKPKTMNFSKWKTSEKFAKNFNILR